MIPKVSLTGAPTERVDTRVLQVIYSFAAGAWPVKAGQQMDIFIDDSDPRKPVNAPGLQAVFASRHYRRNSRASTVSRMLMTMQVTIGK